MSTNENDIDSYESFSTMESFVAKPFLSAHGTYTRARTYRIFFSRLLYQRNSQIPMKYILSWSLRQACGLLFCDNFKLHLTRRVGKSSSYVRASLTRMNSLSAKILNYVLGNIFLLFFRLYLFFCLTFAFENCFISEMSGRRKEWWKKCVCISEWARISETNKSQIY